MGRPERPVDPEAGPIPRLAHELRELRRGAGNPSYRKMATTAGFSVTTLSQAVAGQRLPSWAVVEGYVRACGGDPGTWEPRWKDAEAAATGAVREEPEEAVPPYRGLARFEPDDHGLFFGREGMIAELGQLVCDRRLAVLFGASGSGKSSLLRAGLIPLLREKIAELGNPAVLRVFTPGPRPAETYGHLLTPAEGEPEIWAVVDQFEEVFTLCRDRAERARFIDLLLAARDAGSRLKVLITVRADFYPRCAEHRTLADALHGAGLLLGPMTADELREAVIKPAQAVGLLVERELTARIVEEVLDRPGGLPMLSHALLETWRRRKGRLLTLAAYEAAGGVRGAIAASAEEVFGRLGAEEARTARRLLLRMVEPGRGTPDTRRPLTRAELLQYPDPEAPGVLDRLARARLLTADEDGVQLAHEALMTCWPRFADWIDEDRERLRCHRELTEAARVWLEHDRDPGALYRGARLTRAEDLLADPGALTAAEGAFLTAALEAREAEQRTAARTARRSRTLLTALSAVLAVALVAGLVAWTQSRDNDRRRTEEAARRVASVADALRTTDPRTAMLLGVAAWRMSELPEARRALLGSLAQPELASFTDPVPGDSPQRFLADSGRTLLSADGRTWRTWDVSTHRLLTKGRLPKGDVFSAGPDARVLAVSTADGVRLWDTVAGRWTGGPDPLPAAAGVTVGATNYLVRDLGDASEDGESGEDQIRVASLKDGRTLLDTRTAALANPSLSSDGRLVALCADGPSPRVYDLTDGRTVSGGWEHSSDCGADLVGVQLDRSGDRLTVASATGLAVWDVRSGRRIADVNTESQFTALSRDGSFLATADRDEIRVWRLSNPATPVFRTRLNNQRLYRGLHWDPQRPVLRYLEGGTVHALDLTAAVTDAWHAQALDNVLLSPDGRTLATAERTGAHYRFQLRDTRGGRVLRTLPSVDLPVSRESTQPVVPSATLSLMSFSTDGTAFAYGVSAPGREAAPQRVALWDVRRGRARTTVDLAAGGSTTAVVRLALGPSGRTLYTTRTTATGALSNEVWDTAGGRRTRIVSGLASTHLALRPDGRLLVGDNRTAVLPAAQVAGIDLVQGDQIGALAFAADGSLLAAGDMTGRVALWDGRAHDRKGILRNVFPSPVHDLQETVSALALSPDGRTLAVGGDAGTLQLWDTQSQQPLGDPLTTPGDAVKSLAFGPDGTTLYASSAHVPSQHYVIDPAKAVAEVCARAGGDGLTRAQWRTHIADVPYRRICD
ncbi:hypothetical protein [Streptomyces sp. AS02]|uniref:nSTAND1 domain-containing NTPase n=1 Tax=Streptomyces sp. AS02 TaxID=2938946 RepID=UPI0020218D0F|nr:hypothetical protein [Streptomyces sp. AS02]MCL8014920.1 hypothetical protein [Streptomyces sp. AS02]